MSRHPLVPLSSFELDLVANAVRSNDAFPQTGNPGLNTQPVFAQTQLKEPKKHLIKLYEINSNDVPDRIAESLIYEPVRNRTHIFQTQLTPADNPTSATVIKVKVKDVIPAMDQYIYPPDGPQGQWPTFRGIAPDFTGETMDEVIVRNKKLLKILSQRGVTKEDIISGAVRADYIGGFESFRESNAENGCCGELVKADNPDKRYSTIYFRFFSPSPLFTEARTQTPVLNGDNPPVGPGVSYYDANNRLEGLVVRINLTDREILDIVDLGFEKVPDIVPDNIVRPKHGWRTSIKPIIHDVPCRVDGSPDPSFTYDADTGLVQFDNWQFRLSWDYRAGIQLYQVKYSDTEIEPDSFGNPVEKVRSVLYKASLSDTVVSYSVSNPFFRRNFTSADSMFYPLLRRLIRLQRGTHVPHHATLVSVPLSDRDGFWRQGVSNVDLNEVVGIYEEDGDLLNIYTGTSGPASRGRNLVVRTVFSGLFYLWVFDWIFKQDGTIECKVDVAGRIVVALRENQPLSPWGRYVSKNYLGLFHNHLYCYRFDFDVDGDQNTVMQVDTVPAPNTRGCYETSGLCPCKKRNKSEHSHYRCKSKHSHKKNHNSYPLTDSEDNEGSHHAEEHQLALESESNPCGHGVLTHHTEFKKELEAVSDVRAASNRFWMIMNPHSKLRHKDSPRGYAIRPQANGGTMSQDWSWLNSHLGFAKHNFFVTKYADNEQYASGNFPILAKKDVGLGSYIQQNREIEDTDVVCWYTIAFMHNTYAEDWPFISLASQGVRLVPHDFFEWSIASTLPTQVIYSSNTMINSNGQEVSPCTGQLL